MTGDHTDEFLDSARAVLRSADGDASSTDALHQLGWWELLDDLGNPEVRRAVFILFRAQGRELASTEALGGLAALPYLSVAGLDATTTTAAFVRHSVRRGEVAVLVGEPTAESVLVDLGDAGVLVVAR
ncbi:MAG: hypothetical protein KDB21_09670, partial [Acidimicrobiales bacterium]|nr:hypothetical protein [Acidimicrobiales bacterium]